MKIIINNDNINNDYNKLSMNNCTFNVLLNMKKYKLEKIDKGQWRFYDSDNIVNLLLTNENAKKVYLNSYNEKIKKIANETERLDNIREELDTDIILVATGRKPFTDGLNLKTVGIELNQFGQIFYESNYKYDFWNSENIT